ncbi:RNase P/RNase MRP complex subunit [Polyrhizophydium stewartii]|uniref:RNase P/RNase MRP complex subunit n=1 Tax=Polyrhizophydium stewartii TaxID=2732419 RepID=A0ABR4N3N9_9FUNG
MSDTRRVEEQSWHSPLPAALVQSIMAESASASASASASSGPPAAAAPGGDAEASTFAESWVSSLVSHHSDPAQVFAQRVQGKQIQMDSLEARMIPGFEDRSKAKAEKQRRRFHARHAARFTRRERKAVGLFDVPRECVQFGLFVPLHVLWSQYMAELLAPDAGAMGAGGPRGAAAGAATLAQAQAAAKPRPTQAAERLSLSRALPANVLAKLVKADFHGAMLTVAKSKCPANVGLSGIVIKDTENTFHLVTRDNKLKVVPKLNNVFTFGIGDTLFTLFGNQFRTRPAERATKKFKVKMTVDM